MWLCNWKKWHQNVSLRQVRDNKILLAWHTGSFLVFSLVFLSAAECVWNVAIISSSLVRCFQFWLSVFHLLCLCGVGSRCIQHFRPSGCAHFHQLKNKIMHWNASNCPAALLEHSRAAWWDSHNTSAHFKHLKFLQMPDKWRADCSSTSEVTLLK